MQTFSDNFDRADAAVLGNEWTDAFFFPPSPPDYFSIEGNRAKVTGITGGPNGGARWGVPGRFWNWDITVKARRDAGQPWLGIIARALTNDTFYYFVLRGGSGDWVLRKVVDGTVTQLTSAAFTWNVGQEVTLRFRVFRNSLKVFIDGVQQGSTITDAAIDGKGECGLYAAAGSASDVGTFNDFSATVVEPLVFVHTGGRDNRGNTFLRENLGDTAPALAWTNATQGSTLVVISTTHVYFADGNFIRKLDPETGVVVASRDFGAGVEGRIAAAMVDGVERIYLIKDRTSAAPVIHCIRADDLTDIWTRTLGQAVFGSLFVHETTAGFLVLTVDTGSPATTRATRDDGGTFTALWTSTVIQSVITSSPPGGDKIFGGDGTNFKAVNAADGAQAWSVAGHPGGTALALELEFTHGMARLNPTTDLRRFAVGTGATAWTLVQPFGAGNSIGDEPAIAHDGDFIIRSGTSLKAYSRATPTLLWTYTHSESTTGVFIDHAKRFYVFGATKIQCRRFSDQALLWELTTTSPATMRHVAARRILILQAGKMQGLTGTPGKSFHATAAIATKVGAEGEPLGFNWPQQRVFLAADGRALHLYVYEHPTAGTVRVAWQQSGFNYYDIWSGENQIDSFSVGSVVNAFGADGWLDGNDHAYIAYYGRQNTAKIGFVKLTKGDAGWSQGTVVAVSTAIFADNITICKVPTSGRLWILFARQQGGNYGSFYSDNDGSTWTAGPDFGAAINASQSPISVVAFANKVLMVRKTTTPAIVAKERSDADAPATWSADTTLWSGAQVNSTDTFHHGPLLRVANHANATVIAVMRGSDQIGRVKKYVDGTGWIAGDTQYGSGLAVGATRSVWDGNENKLLLWPTTPPSYYNPVDNALTGTTFDAATSSHGSPVRNGRWYGGTSGGIAGVSILYFHEESVVAAGVLLTLAAGVAVEARAGVFRQPQVPVEMRRTVFVDRRLEVAYLLNTQVLVDPRLEVEILRASEPVIFPIPAEWDGTEQLRLDAGIQVEAIKILRRDGQVPVESILRLRHPTGLEVEARAGLRYGTEIPVEFTGSIAVLAPSEIPVEARAALAAGARIEVEASGLLVIRSDHTLSLETIGQLVRDAVLDVEAAGAGLSIVHVWKVLRKLTEPFLHEWIVVPVAGTFSIQHQWTVRQILGGSLPHTWRVLPQELVTAFSDDIQLPYGKAEK